MDFIAATPGRLLALCGGVPASTRARQLAAAAAAGHSAPAPAEGGEEEAVVSLEGVRTLVLDEADRMLDLGFAEDIDALAALIAARGGESLPFLSAAVHPHTWMFSATWPPGVAQLAAKLLLPGAVHIAIGSTTEDRGPEGEGGQALVAAASVTQRFEQMKGKGAPRMRRLTELLAEILGDPDEPPPEQEDVAGVGQEVGGKEPGRVLVFVLYKKEASDVAKVLAAKGFSAVPLHGDMSQSARSTAMEAFRSGEAAVLVATDVAARGLDVAEVSHVINFSFGMSLENYVHRVGRCGRAGRRGVATTFFVDGDEKFAPALLELLQRGGGASSGGARQPPPSAWLRELAASAKEKEAKAAKRGQREMTEEEQEELERRIENRERQRAQQQQRKARERGGPGGGGRRGRGQDGGRQGGGVGQRPTPRGEAGGGRGAAAAAAEEVGGAEAAEDSGRAQRKKEAKAGKKPWRKKKT